MVSFQHKDYLLLLNHSQGDMGQPGPNGIPLDTHYAGTGPTSEIFRPDQYKVMGLRQNGQYSQLNYEKEKKGNFL